MGDTLLLVVELVDIVLLIALIIAVVRLWQEVMIPVTETA